MVGRFKSVALAVSPLVHVERGDMVTANVPFFKEVNRPLIHSHGTYGKDHGKFLASVSCLFDLKSDLVPHIGVEVGYGVAGDGLELLVPESLFFGAFFAALVDFFHIPALRIESFKGGTFNRGHKIHNGIPPFVIFIF